ncbi:MAG: AbrB family transcriptional regulator [Desulfurococcales archaeon ex4484_42]|nr:MAG: AbrB family transcriptional regulator [Desulfurococcales archaeon ex4484_42]
MGNAGTIPLKIRVGKRFTITIPKEVREKLNIKEGDELEVIVVDDGIMLRKIVSLIEFIDSVKPKGSIKEFLKEREEEIKLENERVNELIK